MNIEPYALRKAVDAHRTQILEWTKQLIRYPTENRPPGGNEWPGQQFIFQECEKMGWEVELFSPEEVKGIHDHASWLPGRDYSGNRKNVAARWKGAGSGRSLLVSGHLDVAPYEPDEWRICRPFEPVIQDGRLYGRGSADMKGGLAAAFWAMKILSELGFRPSGDIVFDSVVDEEFAGGNGTLASRLRGYNADLAVLMEPSRMQVCPACMGAFPGDLVIKGKAGMPYTGSAIPNPIQGAATAVDLFYQWQSQWRSANSHHLFEEEGKELNVVLWCVTSRTPGERTTQMGTPLMTRISWIVWCYPGMTEEEFYRRFREFWEYHRNKEPNLRAFQMELRPTYHHVRAWETEADNQGVQHTVKAFKEYTGRDPVVGGAPFSCDLAIYGDAGGMPCLILGPGGDNLHAPDEWVRVDDLLDLTGILALLAVQWCG
ncbi:MAG: M20 family metallopeptidase [Spirochaetota bacterium]